MKSIVNSQLKGKWYKHTRDTRSRELEFMEIFIYLSTCHDCRMLWSKDKNMDLLYVGVKEDHNKILRKMSLRIMYKSDCNYLIVKSFLSCKKFKVLLFDEENGFLILSDKNMKNISIYSRKYKITRDVIEDYLKRIELKNPVKMIMEDFSS